MKNILIIFLFCSILFPSLLQAQVTGVTVETYYVSDESDSAGSVGYVADTLLTGSTTYRVFIQLGQGYTLKRIFGDANHTLRISSTSNFYNNSDRGAGYNFGYLVSKAWFPGNPSLFLDSWLTIGKATSTQAGVLKTEDPDKSIITTSYSMLKNCDPAAGICITDSDGLMPSGTYTGTWSSKGIVSINNDDSTAFGNVKSGNEFLSNNAYLLHNPGIAGPLPDNKILVAQLTTKGTLSFELNIEVLDSNGKSKFCVATGVSSSNSDTLISPSLKYPPECGCLDPQYLEYNPSFSCNLQDSCKTHIIFGCMDTLACNYDPHANFNVQGLCCYPGRCNDRDLALVCPSVTASRPQIAVYPNPASNEITLKAENFKSASSKFVIYNSYGNEIIAKEIEINSNSVTKQVDVSNLRPGLYMIRLFNGDDWESKNFMKN